MTTCAVVGTSSLRRQPQLLARRPDLTVEFLRGNVGTRLAKLDSGQYQGIILACAGLIRLGMPERIAQVIDADWLLPAVGQGAVGIETRAKHLAQRAPQHAADIDAALHRLVADDQMGKLFKVMGLAGPKWIGGAAFSAVVPES